MAFWASISREDFNFYKFDEGGGVKRDSSLPQLLVSGAGREPQQFATSSRQEQQQQLK